MLRYLALTGLLAVGSAAFAQSGVDNLVGKWEGDSICADKVRYPSVRDEHVLYTVTKTPRKDEVHVKADKLVNGKFELMGEFDFKVSESGKRLKSEMKTPRYHGMWDFQVKGSKLTGVLADVESKRVVRTINARKRT